MARVATRIGWWRSIKRRNAGSWIKLRQTIKRLVRESVLSPILTQSAEIMIKRPVFLRQKNNMVYWPDVDGSAYRLVHRHVHRASGTSAACASPIYEVRVSTRCRSERDLRSRSKISSANCSAGDSSRVARNRSSASARELHHQGVRVCLHTEVRGDRSSGIHDDGAGCCAAACPAPACEC